MLNGKHVAVISRNRLLGVGLKTILLETFSPEHVELAETINLANHDHSVDYLFVTPELYVAYQSQLEAIKQRVVVLSENVAGETADGAARVLNVALPQAEIIDQLESIFRQDENNRKQNKQLSLSVREIDVLKLVARGFINKHIADKLSISLHTVISHRQNITRKLGIKTVSGLTVYAMLNGLISSKDVR